MNDQEAWRSRPQKVKVPMKLSAIKKIDVNLSDDSNRLKEPVVITITNGTRTETLVVHRPVGVNTLQPDDWVLTPIGEVEPLLAAAVDPSAKKKEDAKRKFRIDYLVKKGKYTLNSEKEACYPKEILGGITLTAANKTAKTAYDAAHHAAKQQYLAECEFHHRQPKKDWKYGQAINHFLPEAIKVYESNLREQLKKDQEYIDGVKKLDPVQYETLAGPFQDRPQFAVRFRGPKPTDASLIDVIKKNLVNTMSGGYALPIDPPKSLIEALQSSKDDKERVAKLITTLLPTSTPGEQSAGGTSTTGGS